MINNQRQRMQLERRRARLLDRQERLWRLLLLSHAPVLPAKRLASFLAVSKELQEMERQLAALSS
ncbi:hypothetical protein LAJ19_03275 [Deinococcus taeanensis]|uniref:hypothetical protein n=1 Tax=Deinococcus taeanensis TaxID=2737050 RepID=UPI001CDC9866|nr:hypothetical protein [Deinococcus taeanensis]UBV43252.1 hypothetical protein LAJ19_03275 [Deinococcus taeanensis]